jgi:hypothetical protein
MKRSFAVSVFLTCFLVTMLIGLSIPTQTLAADRSDVEAFVTRFYELCLGRSPDAAGLDGWVSALMDGSKTGSDVAYGFVFSPEFVNQNTSNDEYLGVLYAAFFNRPADAAGLQGWLDAMASGASREDVLKGFIFAAEFAELCEEYGIKAFDGHVTKAQKALVEAFVTRFYQLCLDRDPDPAGLDSWVNNLLNQSQTGADVANGFIFSSEFVAKNTTAEEYLLILYEAFFDRAADQAGWNAWMAELAKGTGRDFVLNGFIYSEEFSQLCLQYGINAYDSIPQPIDNTRFYGTYQIDFKIGACPTERFILTIGNDQSREDEDQYIFLPEKGTIFLNSGYDQDGDFSKTNATVSEYALTIHEEGTDADGSTWTFDIVINFDASYNSFTFTGSEFDDDLDPGECQGAISGGGTRLQSGGTTGGMWVGQAVATTATDYYGDPCAGGSIQFELINNSAYGTFTDAEGDQFELYGTIDISGKISLGAYAGGQLVAGASGTLSTAAGSGSWIEYMGGCQGTWSVTKQ